jgi:16S rRNA processing protein RimM
VLGRVASAHGVRGWLKVLSFTEPPEGLLRYPVWRLRRSDGTETSYRLRDAQWDGRWVRAALEDVTDRDAAERLRGCQIEVDRSELPPTGEREYYQEDLVGLQVRNQAGVLLGRVSHFVAAPVQAIMVVAGTREYWVPAAPPHLRRVRLEQGEIEVDWPADL